MVYKTKKALYKYNTFTYGLSLNGFCFEEPVSLSTALVPCPDREWQNNNFSQWPEMDFFPCKKEASFSGRTSYSGEGSTGCCVQFRDRLIRNKMLGWQIHICQVSFCCSRTISNTVCGVKQSIMIQSTINGPTLTNQGQYVFAPSAQTLISSTVPSCDRSADQHWNISSLQSCTWSSQKNNIEKLSIFSYYHLKCVFKLNVHLMMMKYCRTTHSVRILYYRFSITVDTLWKVKVPTLLNKWTKN